MAQSQNLVEYNGRTYEPKFKVYSIDIARSGVANAVASGTLQVDSQSPFIMDALHASDTTDTTNTDVQTDFLCQLQDNESGYQWSDGWASRAAVFGRRGWGRRIPGMQVIRPGARLTIQLKDNGGGAGTTTVTVEGRSLMAR